MILMALMTGDIIMLCFSGYVYSIQILLLTTKQTQIDRFINCKNNFKSELSQIQEVFGGINGIKFSVWWLLPYVIIPPLLLKDKTRGYSLDKLTDPNIKSAIYQLYKDKHIVEDEGDLDVLVVPSGCILPISVTKPTNDTEKHIIQNIDSNKCSDDIIPINRTVASDIRIDIQNDTKVSSINLRQRHV